MAETFLALRRGPGGFEQKVCIKRILPAFEHDADFVESFLQEARTSAALRHANIVQVHDFGIADGSHYLALELVDGLDLRALLHPNGASAHPLDAELVCLIAGDLLLALEHAHGGDPSRPSVVHRDISPSNVLISRAGEVKLTDFGIARAMEGTHRTATGVIKGKVPYMPPEYIEHGRFDARGDLFSLGVLLFELLAGSRPFDGETDLDTLRRIVSGERRDLRSQVRGLPPALAAVVERLIAHVPEKRFQSARDALEHLPQIPVHAARRRLAERVQHPVATGATPASGTSGSDPALPLAMAATRTAPPSFAASFAPKPAAGGRLALIVVAIVGSLALSVAAWYALSSEPARVADARAPRSPIERPPQLPVASAPATDPSPAQPPSQAPEQSADAAPSAMNTTLPMDSSPPAEIEPSKGPRTGELKVFVYPYGNVWIDDKNFGQSPVTARLSPGSHRVGIGDVRAREFHTVRLVAGSHERLELRRSSTDPSR